MKLKRLVAGFMTSVMIVAGVPVFGLKPATTWADVLDDEAPQNAATREEALEGLGIYSYRSISDGVTASSDGAFKAFAGVNLMTDASTKYALSRFNTGNMPISGEMTDNNNIYFSLGSATDLSRMIWWTTNRADLNYDNGIGVQKGTVLRCRLYVSEEGSAANTADAMEKLTWSEGVVVAFDPNKNSIEENEYNRVAFQMDLQELFREKANNVKTIRMEALNTAGRYFVQNKTAVDESNHTIVGNGVEIYSQNDASAKLSNLSVCADFSTRSGNDLTKLLNDISKTVRDVKDPTGDARMESLDGGGAANTEGKPVYTQYGRLTDNNNIYLTMRDEKTGNTVSRTIGRLTYMAGVNYGSLSEIRIYTSNHENAEYEGDGALEQIDDWNLVYSNVSEDEQKTGKTEYLNEETNTTDYLEGDNIVPWEAYRSAPKGWENAHVAVFDEPACARYVRIEVVRTANARNSQLESLENKWISGRNIYIYEAKEAMRHGDVDRIELKAQTPFLNTALGRVDVLNETSAYLDGNSWTWTDEKGNEVTGVTALKATMQEYTLKVTLSVKEPDRILDPLVVTIKPCKGDNEDEVEAKTIPAKDIQILPAQNGVAKITVTYKMDRPEETTQAYRALRDYVTSIKSVYDQGNRYAENEAGKPAGVGLNDHKYTDRAWNDFAEAFEKAQVWTQTQTIPGGDDQGATEEPGEGDDGPTGRHTLGEYTEALQTLTKLHNNLAGSLIYGREALPESDKLDLVLTKPVAGESPVDVRTAYAGMLESNSDIALEYRPSTVLKDGFIYGKAGDDGRPGSASEGVAHAPSSDTKNRILDFSGTTQFMIHFKMKLSDVPTEKQTIVGNLNDGYGVQLLEKKANEEGKDPYNPYGDTAAALVGYARFNDTTEANGDVKEQWAQVEAPLDDNWFGETEHDIIFLYDGDKLIMYVDGVPGTDSRGVRGALRSHDQPYEFAVGYNPRVESQQGNEGEFFKGGFKDFRLFADVTAEDQTEYEVPAYEELEALAKPEENNENWTQNAFMEKLTEILDAKNPLVTLSPTELNYSVYDTEWTAIRDEGMSQILTPNAVFNEYMGYKVRVVIEAAHPYQFTSETQGTGILKDPEGSAAYEADVKLSDHNTAMTLVYTFDPLKEHPRDVLKEYIDHDVTDKVVATDHAALVDRNETAEGIRVYTQSAWAAYLQALNTARALTGTYKKYDEYIEQYNNAKSNLEQAVEELKLASDTCECTIGEITGFESETLNMGNSTSASLNLADLETAVTGNKNGSQETPDYGANGDACLKHKDTGEEDLIRFVYELDDTAPDANTAGAVLEDQVLTVYKRGHADVKLTAYYGDQTRSSTVRFEVIGAVADEEQRDELVKAIQDAKSRFPSNDGTYSRESWNQFMAAVNDAIRLVGDPGDPDSVGDLEAAAGDVAAAKSKLAEAVRLLEQEKNQAAGAQQLALAIQSAAQYLGQESLYTPESFGVFKKAYEAATAANRDESKLAELAANLKNAIAGLKKNAVSGGGTNGTNDGFQNQYSEAVSGVTYQVTNASAMEVIVTKGKKAAKVKIPATVKVGGRTCKVVGIATGAFKNYSSLKEITIGKNVKNISKNAFTKCKKLNKIIFQGKKLPSMKKAFSKTKKSPTVKVVSALKKKSKIKKNTLNKLKKAGLAVTIKNIK